MANRKISEFTALTAPDSSDVLAIIDQSESGADKNKKITYANLLSKIPDGSVATPSLSFLSDQNSGISGGSDTLNFVTGGASAIAIDSSQNVTLSANLTVNGTTTTINTTNLDVEDKNITLAKVSSPSDSLADGGGITIKGTTDKTFNWVNSTDAFTSSEHIHLGDNKKLLVGTGSDLEIYHDGSHSYLHQSGTGELKNRAAIWKVVNEANSEIQIKATENAAVELYYDNSLKLQTISNGVYITNGDYKGGDDAKLNLGASGDFQIYHSDTLGNVIGAVGGHTTKFYGPQVEMYSLDGTKKSFVSDSNGTVELYFNNAKHFETTTTGVSWGTTRLRCDDNGMIELGTGQDLKIYHNATNSEIKNDTGIFFIRGDSLKLTSANGENYLIGTANGSCELYWDNNLRLNTNTSGIAVTGTVTETSDISLKNNINTIQNPLDLIEQIRGINFTWKTNGMKSMGVIAQDVEKVFPELVHGSEGSKSLQYSGLIGALVESVKELSAKVAALEAK